MPLSDVPVHRRRLGTSGTSRTSQTGQARWTSPCIPASPLTESNKLDSHPSNPVTTTTALGRSPSSGNSNGSSELEPLTKTALTKSQSEASAQQPRAYFALASQVRMRQDETTMDNKPAAAGQSAFAGFRHSSVALQSNEPRTATQATTLERPTGPSPLLPSASDPRASSHVRARLAGRSAMARPSSRTRRESADAVGGTPSCNTAAASHMPLEIGAWVPEAVAEAYRSSGLTHIFVWQAECLALRCFEDGVNLLVSAPTSAGKTLLAEILLFRTCLERRKRAMFVLPYIAVASEKLEALRPLCTAAGLSLAGYMGNQHPIMMEPDVSVCTIEKANGLINRLLEEGRLNELGAVVIDELHLVGDPQRGPVLETLLTKLRVAAPGTLLVGISATLPCTVQLEQWLAARLYFTDFRPVRLSESMVLDGKVYRKETPNYPTATLGLTREEICSKLGLLPRTVPPALLEPEWLQRARLTASKTGLDTLRSAVLIRGILASGECTLVFMSRRADCETCAKILADLLGPLPEPALEDVAHALADPSQTLGRPDDEHVVNRDASDTERDDSEDDPVASGGAATQQVPLLDERQKRLRRMVQCGVAYHHAGLSQHERQVIEDAFRRRHIRVLCTTTTLAAGVNLPASCVLIRCLRMYQKAVLTTTLYQQMAGRAGRTGANVQGEVYLFGSGAQEGAEARRLIDMRSSAEESVSQLLGLARNPKAGAHSEYMRRAVLEAAVGGLAPNALCLADFSRKTLLACVQGATLAEGAALEAVRSLKAAGFLVDTAEQLVVQDAVQTTVGPHAAAPAKSNAVSVVSPTSAAESNVLQPTRLGQAAVAAALTPAEASTVVADLHLAHTGLVLSTDLHLVYLTTPLGPTTPAITSWDQLHTICAALSPDEKEVATRVGVSEAVMACMISGQSIKDERTLAVHRRFFAALALHELVQEAPLPRVAARYGLTQGALQALQAAASSYAGMVTVFCQRMGMTNLELLLAQFQERLSLGVRSDVLRLLALHEMTPKLARFMIDRRLDSVEAVAAADVAVISDCVRRSLSVSAYRGRIGEQLQRRHQQLAERISKRAKDAVAIVTATALAWPNNSRCVSTPARTAVSRGYSQPKRSTSAAAALNSPSSAAKPRGNGHDGPTAKRAAFPAGRSRPSMT